MIKTTSKSCKYPPIIQRIPSVLLLIISLVFILNCSNNNIPNTCRTFPVQIEVQHQTTSTNITTEVSYELFCLTNTGEDQIFRYSCISSNTEKQEFIISYASEQDFIEEGRTFGLFTRERTQMILSFNGEVTTRISSFDYQDNRLFNISDSGENSNISASTVFSIWDNQNRPTYGKKEEVDNSSTTCTNSSVSISYIPKTTITVSRSTGQFPTNITCSYSPYISSTTFNENFFATMITTEMPFSRTNITYNIKAENTRCLDTN